MNMCVQHYVSDLPVSAHARVVLLVEFSRVFMRPAALIPRQSQVLFVNLLATGSDLW